MTITIPKLLTIKKAADELGISYYRIRRWCLEGLIGYKKFGNRYMVNIYEVIEFIKINDGDDWDN